MSDLTEFQQRACALALVRMFSERHFSICTLDAIAATMNKKGSMAGRDYEALRSIHCVNWADMGPDLARMTREKCLELLGLPPQTVEVLMPEKKEKPEEPAKRLRLAFWK